MTLPTPVTFYGAVLKISTTAIEDGTVEMGLTVSRETPEATTWGGSISAAGSLKGSGNINTIYDETASSPYMLLMAELLTPTAGGLSIVFQPKGAGVGTNREITFNIVVGQGEFGGGGEDIQQVNFPFTTTGAIGDAVQA